MKKLRDYQEKISIEAVCKLRELGIVYLAMQVRTGKTITALNTAYLYKAKSVLFLTKKKAIQSILNDYNDFNFSFDIVVTNYENLHKIDGNFDLLICDEHHSNGAFPKPSKRTQEIRKRFSSLPMIFLSGTPATESLSQYYHQFWISKNTPFKDFINFYKWSNTFVDVQVKYVSYGAMKDYSKGKEELINKFINKYMIHFTQEESGFESKVNLKVLHFDSCNQTLIKRLEKDLIIEGKSEVILADSGIKLMQKIHQLENGTIKFESGKSQVLCTKKIDFIKEHFKGQKLAIMYYFKEELILLQDAFTDWSTGEIQWTESIEEFNTTDKHYLGQQYASAMGINLSKADSLVFYNFGYSGTNFIQSIDRMTTKDRLENNVYFVYGKGSLTERIFNVVKNKKNFTEKQFYARK